MSNDERELVKRVALLDDIARVAADFCICCPNKPVSGDAWGRLIRLSDLLNRYGVLEERHTFPRPEPKPFTVHDGPLK